jgi:tetratricopeptide (TPR) repeat protein
MRQHTWAIALLSAIVVMSGGAIAQPAPKATPTVAPAASSPAASSPANPALATPPRATGSPSVPLAPQSDRGPDKTLLQERWAADLKLSEQIQASVNANFGWAIGLLTALIAILGIFPIVLGVLIWLLRGSVIQQTVTAIKRQLDQDIAEAVKEQFEQRVAAQVEQQVKNFKQELETLKHNLALATQLEKDRIFAELAQITPSVIQEEIISPADQERLQVLTKQLDSLQAVDQLDLTVGDYLKQGDAFYYEGRYDDAIAAYDQALQKDPSSCDAWVLKGKALRRSKRYEEALAASQTATQINPDNPWGWFGQGYALRELRRYEEALAAYDQAIQVRTNHYHAWKHRSYVLTKLGRYLEAEASFEKALTLQKNPAGTYYNQASFYAAQEDSDRAVEALALAIQLDPKFQVLARSDPDFDSIRHSPRFLSLMTSSPKSA